MKYGHVLVLAALLHACGGSPSDDSAQPVESTGGEVTAVGSAETTGQANPEAEIALVAREDAEHQARCGDVTLIPGLPPAPPSLPATPAYDALHVTYEAALASPPPTTTSREVMERWGQEIGGRMGLLNQGVGALPEAERGPGLLLLALTFARLAEVTKSQPVPADITDPNGQLEYRRGFYRAAGAQLLVGLEHAQNFLEGARVDGAWAEYKTTLETWIVQESCDRGY
ncbi:MAG: hypothetical protein ACI9KE_001848 [Polyangiales bacterium]|jgi:hypothetical protein